MYLLIKLIGSLETNQFFLVAFSLICKIVNIDRRKLTVKQFLRSKKMKRNTFVIYAVV